MLDSVRGVEIRIKFFNSIRRTIGLRLYLWYSAIFILSFLVLFILAHSFLSSSLQKYDKRDIRIELNELATQYQRGGIDAVQKELDFEKHTSGENTFFVRLEKPEGNTVFLNIPDEWEDFDLKQLENTPISGNRKWMEIPAKSDDEVLEVLSTRLSDGSLLRVGKNIDIREDHLEPFRYASAGVLLLLSFSVGAFLAFRAVRPIRGFISTLQSVMETDSIETRVPVSKRGDEFDELGTMFNRTLEKIEILINGMRNSLDNVAHDLRTPMTRLRGVGEMALQSENDPEALREALSDCLEESERILIMLNTLIDISEAETGAMKLDLEKVNISNLSEDVVELYNYVAEEKGVSIQINCPKELYLIADSNRMGQILANLLDNAIKYTPTGGKIDIEACHRDGEIAITVKDTGVGIPPEELDKIWDRLYRGDKSRSQRGFGLGLSLVKAIVGAHGGYTEVFSELGVGSVFTVYLPKKVQYI